MRRPKFDFFIRKVNLYQADAKTVAEHLAAWSNDYLSTVGGASIRPVSKAVNQIIPMLEPFVSSMWTRQVVTPIVGGLAAQFDNNYRGTDPSGVSVLSQKVGCRALRVTAVEHTLKKVGDRQWIGKYGGMILQVFDAGKSRRTISAMNDGGRWDFYQKGEPFEFEELDAYQNRRIKDRFTFEMMRRYLGELGVCPFDMDSYICSDDVPFYVIDRNCPLPGQREIEYGGFRYEGEFEENSSS